VLPLSTASYANLIACECASDDHAYNAMMASLNLSSSFDLREAPDYLQDDLMEKLVLPEYVGCGHLKNMMLNPGVYQTPLEGTNRLLKSLMRVFVHFCLSFSVPQNCPFCLSVNWR
jgi:hypothetical protein